MKSFAAELKDLRKNRLKISKSELSRLLKVSEKTLAQLESGKSKPSRAQRNIFGRLTYLIGKLRFKKNIRKAEFKWLEKSLPALNNLRPADHLETNKEFQKMLASLKELGL